MAVCLSLADSTGDSTGGGGGGGDGRGGVGGSTVLQRGEQPHCQPHHPVRASRHVLCVSVSQNSQTSAQRRGALPPATPRTASTVGTLRGRGSPPLQYNAQIACPNPVAPPKRGGADVSPLAASQGARRTRRDREIYKTGVNTVHSYILLWVDLQPLYSSQLFCSLCFKKNYLVLILYDGIVGRGCTHTKSHTNVPHTKITY